MSELREAFHFLKYNQLQYLRRPIEEAASKEASEHTDIHVNGVAEKSAANNDIGNFKTTLEKDIIPRLLELSYEGDDWSFFSSLCLRALDNLVAFHSSQLASALDAYIFYDHVHDFLLKAEKALKPESN